MPRRDKSVFYFLKVNCNLYVFLIITILKYEEISKKGVLMAMINSAYAQKTFSEELHSFLDEVFEKVIHFVYKNHKYLGYF